jgi:hypothetical protein
VRTRRRDASQEPPLSPEPPQLLGAERSLEARKELILFITDVLSQQRDRAIDERVALGCSGATPLQVSHDLGDLLVLALDTDCELVAVG